jgi:hypothetical protein
MKSILANRVFHPFFLAAYMLLFLMAYNVTQIPVTQLWRPLAIMLLVALLLTLGLGRLNRNYRQGALSASLIILLFFSYGHVFHYLEVYAPALANHAALGLVWLALFSLGMLLKWRIPNLKGVTEALNISTGALLVWPMLQIAWFVLQTGGATPVKKASPLDNLTPSAPGSTANLPDIYYIIADSYAGADVLQEIYQYDAGAFFQSLEQRGFYVAQDSHSNYPQTTLSLSSALNLEYINYLTDSLGADYPSRDPLAELIRHSALRKFLEDRGYKTVTFATGYIETTITDSTVFINYAPRATNDLETLFLTSSALRALGDRLSDLFSPYDCRQFQRGGVLNVFDNLEKLPSLPGPKFVFAHVLSPHYPFVFGANGEPVDIGPCFPSDNAAANPVSQADYQRGYPQQVAFINLKLQSVIDKIIANSAVPPIIIVQGDHGAGMLMDWNSSANTCIWERTSIFNAYYFPGMENKGLYASITPINSFRVMLNNYFGANLPLLEDKTYFSNWDTPYNFEDVTSRTETRCGLK